MLLIGKAGAGNRISFQSRVVAGDRFKLVSLSSHVTGEFLLGFRCGI